MANNITGLFDNEAIASQVVETLIDRGLNAQVIQQFFGPNSNAQLTDKLRADGVPQDKVDYYSNSLLQGSALVSVRAEDHETQTVVDVMNQFVDPVGQSRSTPNAGGSYGNTQAGSAAYDAYSRSKAEGWGRTYPNPALGAQQAAAAAEPKRAEEYSTDPGKDWVGALAGQAVGVSAYDSYQPRSHQASADNLQTTSWSSSSTAGSGDSTTQAGSAAYDAYSRSKAEGWGRTYPNPALGAQQAAAAAEPKRAEEYSTDPGKDWVGALAGQAVGVSAYDSYQPRKSQGFGDSTAASASYESQYESQTASTTSTQASTQAGSAAYDAYSRSKAEGWGRTYPNPALGAQQAAAAAEPKRAEEYSTDPGKDWVGALAGQAVGVSAYDSYRRGAQQQPQDSQQEQHQDRSSQPSNQGYGARFGTFDRPRSTAGSAAYDAYSKKRALDWGRTYPNPVQPIDPANIRTPAPPAQASDYSTDPSKDWRAALSGQQVGVSAYDSYQPRRRQSTMDGGESSTSAASAQQTQTPSSAPSSSGGYGRYGNQSARKFDVGSSAYDAYNEDKQAAFNARRQPRESLRQLRGAEAYDAYNLDKQVEFEQRRQATNARKSLRGSQAYDAYNKDMEVVFVQRRALRSNTVSQSALERLEAAIVRLEQLAERLNK